MTDFSKVEIKTVRNYWNSRPCNIRHSPRKIGSKEFFDEVEERKYFVEPHIPGFAEFSKWKGKIVLEIGCGIGTDTINFARAGAQVTAIEYSEESLNIAKQRAKVFNLPIKFYHADAETLSKTVPVERYDLVYSFGVIHHTPHPEKAISEIKKYMDKNSVFKIMVYNKNSYKTWWIILKYGFGQFWKKDQLIAKYSEAQTGSPVTYSYTKKSIHDFLNGLIITNIFADHIFPYSIPEYKKYEYKKMWYFRILPNPIFRLMERTLGWHLCVTAKLKEI
jgi:ubiquinone/menaquinone biosynthesis C-methylase UbiE